MDGHNGDRALETLLHDGWHHHDQESSRLARQLESAAGERIAPQRLVAFLYLATHTIGAHLGDWPRALALGRKVLAGHTPGPDTASAWGRLHVAAALAGDAVEAAEIELAYLGAAGDEVGAALLDMRFMLAEALAGAQRMREAGRIYRRALEFVDQIRPSPARDRTIAAAGNNLGQELHEMPARTPDDDALMRLAADTSLKYWLACGSWINAERAHHLVAVVANATGDATAGLAHADAGLAIIAANGERPLDAALLHLARAVSFAALGDTAGGARALRDADAAAAKLAAADLQARFAAERAKVADADRR